MHLHIDNIPKDLEKWIRGLAALLADPAEAPQLESLMRGDSFLTRDPLGGDILHVTRQDLVENLQQQTLN